ncbi:DUF6414 family protein [Halobacterium salinarum]|uniref:DUF6414 family protein n=1 Tax=Halobacterium salinarum TaxID=2242 RepID=UPI0025539EF6|nr:hypothetical protein [Halobacterium salinarum]
MRGWLGLTSLPELREFVYIDEDALISLLASTTGGITQQRTTTQRERISSSIKGSLGPLGSSIGSEKEKATQAVRRYVIQSNFKEFYDMRSGDISITDDPDDPPGVYVAAADSEQIRQVAPGLDSSRTTELSRGRLFELDVTLGSSRIYDYFKVFGAFEEIIDSFSTEEEVRQQLRRQNVSSEKIAMIIDLMDTLMAGLVPIECTISNYGVAQDNQEVLVHKEWADTNGIEYEECRAVGFIDEDNLWQDPTEVLFERDEFTIYGRIDDPIPSTEWNPLKLVDVVQSILPELGNELGNLQTDLEDPESSSTNHGDQSVEDELENYLGWIAEEQGTTLSDESKKAVIESVGPPVLNPLPLSAKKELFESAERTLSEEVDEDMEVSAEQRAEYLSQVWQPRQSGEENEKGNQADENYLTTNFVAIYW